MAAPSVEKTPSPPVRWWPAVVILGLTVFLVGRAWLASEGIRQSKVQATALALLLGSFLLLLWLTFLSRFSRKARLRVWTALLGTAVLFFVSFRYRGLSGDLVPLFEARWKRTPELVSPDRAVDAVFFHHDYPQFLGPYRNATLPGPRLAGDWSARPPRLLWRRPVGRGWSGFAVAGNAAITQEQHGEEEAILRYDLETGEVVWDYRYPARYTSPIAGVGPRATPTIADGRVYTVGGTGLLHALDLRTGKRIWSRDLNGENQARNPEWGKSCSPLVVDGLVVVSAGGAEGKSLVAYDQETGRIVWRGGSDRSSYSSPMVATLAGVRQIVILNRTTIAGHDPADGSLLWSHPWPPGQPNVAQPVLLPGDRLLVSAGYGVGSKVFQIRRGPGATLKAELVWESSLLKAKFTNVVFHEGFVYGLDDGILICLDPRTGERRWKRGRYGHGQVILVQDLLLVQTEGGEVVLVEPNSEELRELGRFRAISGKTWNTPTLAAPYLLLRNDREAVLFELPLADDESSR